MKIKNNKVKNLILTKEEHSKIENILPFRYSLAKSCNCKSKSKKNNLKNINKQDTSLTNNNNIKNNGNKYYFISKALKIIKLIKENKISIHFWFPIDIKFYGIYDYYDYIKEPMDLNTVEKKLKSYIYNNIYDFDYDMKLIWSNAKLYNNNDSKFYKFAIKLKKEYLNLFNIEFGKYIIDCNEKRKYDKKLFNYINKANLIKIFNILNIEEKLEVWEIAGDILYHLENNKINFGKFNKNKLWKLCKYLLKKLNKFNKNFSYNKIKIMKKNLSKILKKIYFIILF